MKLDHASTLTAQAPVSVRPCRDGDAAAWEAFVRACPEATFFHRLGWREILRDVFRHTPHYLLAERAGAIVGVLPLAQMKSRLFGHALVSLPFAVYGGVAASDDAAVPALHAAAAALARELGVDHLELRNRTPREAAWPRQELYVSFRREIQPDDEANLLAIPRKQRAMVRKAIQRGLVAEIDSASTASSRCTPTTSTATARRRTASATSRRCAACSAMTASCSPCSARRARRCPAY